MTYEEAVKIKEDFWEHTHPTEDQVFLFTEAMDYLISEYHLPEDMMMLGGYYYEQKNFDLALKYYEMAAALDDDSAYECLGYIWYYGRTGKTDYEKAFKYFSKMAEKGHLVAAYKVADMYKNGYYVERDLAKYEEIVEDLFNLCYLCRSIHDPVPEIYTRLARIRKDQGRTDEAIELYLHAKEWLARRIKYDSFFGNLSIMKWLIDDLYTLMDFDAEDFDFFDLFYLLKTPHEIEFMWDEELIRVSSVADGDICNVCCNGKWFRTREDFFQKADIKGYFLTDISDELYAFTLV